MVVSVTNPPESEAKFHLQRRQRPRQADRRQKPGHQLGLRSIRGVTSETNAASAEVFRFQYDANNRLTNRWSAAKGTTVYSSDAVGNRTLVNCPVSTDISFTCDALHALHPMRCFSARKGVSNVP
jgi:hypothetical protein